MEQAKDGKLVQEVIEIRWIPFRQDADHWQCTSELMFSRRSVALVAVVKYLIAVLKIHNNHKQK